MNVNPTEPIHTPITRALIHYLGSKGVARNEICRLAGIPPGLLENPEQKFPIKVFNETWVQAARLAHDPCIGLHVGEFLELSALGVVGYLMQSSETLTDAFQAASRYTTVTGGAINLSAVHDSNEWKIIFGLQRAFPESVSFAIRQIIEASMSITVTALNKLSHQTVLPLKATFTQSEPAEISEFQRIFGSSLIFNQEENVLYFESHTASMPVTYSNPTMNAVFEKHARVMLEVLKKKEDISSRVKMVIMDQVRNERLSVNTVAESLFMSSRTLQRKLDREGTSFQGVLDEVRQELAEDYLLRLDMNVADTAFLTGFSETSAFVRSFKRWTGHSPKEFQMLHRKKTEG